MTRARLKDVQLGDARVLGIARTQGEIRLRLDKVRVLGNGQWATVGPVQVTLLGVEGEAASHFVGHNVEAPHPEPDRPLDLIETSEWLDGVLTLGGCKQSQPWFEWKIVARDGVVEWV